MNIIDFFILPLVFLVSLTLLCGIWMLVQIFSKDEDEDLQWYIIKGVFDFDDYKASKKYFKKHNKRYVKHHCMHYSFYTNKTTYKIFYK